MLGITEDIRVEPDPKKANVTFMFDVAMASLPSGDSREIDPRLTRFLRLHYLFPLYLCANVMSLYDALRFLCIIDFSR